MYEFTNVIQYIIPKNTEIVFSILSHVRDIFLELLDGKADIYVEKRKSCLQLQQEFPVPVWESLRPSLKTRTGCNLLVRGDHYVFSSAQNGNLENTLYRVFSNGDNYSFVLEKDIQLQIFPLRCTDLMSYISVRMTRGAPEIFGYKLSSNTIYSLAPYCTVLLKSSDGEPYSINVQGLDRKVHLSVVDENYQMRMEAVKEYIINRCLSEKIFRHITPTILVLGPKNVGKSSFCRLLVNDALQTNITPLYVDLNFQRSLSIPGSLSFTEIEGRADSTLDFNYKVKKLLHFGSLNFHPSNILLYYHLVRKMERMLSIHKRYGGKNNLTIIDTIGTRDFESIERILNSFAVDLVVVVGDNQYYETLKHILLKTVPSEFIPKPRDIEPQNNDYKSMYYQYRIQEYFGCKIEEPYVKNIYTIRLDCFKIYKILAGKGCNAKGKIIHDFKLELIACNKSMVNRLLAVSAANNLELNSVIEVKYYVCFTSIDMATKTVDVMVPEKEHFTGGILLMGYVTRRKTIYDVI